MEDHPDFDRYEEFLDSMNATDLNGLDSDTYALVGKYLEFIKDVMVNDYKVGFEPSSERVGRLWVKTKAQIFRYCAATPGSAPPIIE